MKDFISQINATTDIKTLQNKKEQIKNKVVASDSNWKSRMALYKKVQMINRRIEDITKASQVQ